MHAAKGGKVRATFCALHALHIMLHAPAEPFVTFSALVCCIALAPIGPILGSDAGQVSMRKEKTSEMQGAASAR